MSLTHFQDAAEIATAETINDNDNGVAVPPQKLDANLASLDLTDIGNAERLIARHGHGLRYSQAEKWWYVWDGVCCATDASSSIQTLSVAIRSLRFTIMPFC